MNSKERADETIQMLFRIAKQTFENDVRLEERTVNVLLNVCEQAQKQFHKIKEASEIEDVQELRKRTREYAEVGHLFLETCKKNFRLTSESKSLELPEEARKDGPSTSEYNEDILPASDPLKTISPDFAFVESFRSSEKMSWNTCFNAGRARGLFTQYKDFKSLKNFFFLKSRSKQCTL